MELITTPAEMRAWSRRQRCTGRRVGVVPTMGALHAGHLELVAGAAALVDDVVVTIFVNPLQFDQANDFDSYPRPIDDDVRACELAGVAAVYAPTAAVMYPDGYQTHVEPGELADRLEGPMRPGHFRGVVTAVTKLFGATEPDVAMFGRKDYQQLAIVRRMVADLDLGVDIVGVPIVREPDGLALSSRNVRLTPADRSAAVVLSRSLLAGRRAYLNGDTVARSLVGLVRSLIEAEPRADLEYVELVDGANLRAVDEADDGCVILTAAWFGGVRLIDNTALGDEPRS